MEYSKYFFDMSEVEQDEYAIRAGTTGRYLRTHVLVPSVRRKIPRRDKIEGLVNATCGACTIDDVLSYLYKTEDAKAA